MHRFTRGYNNICSTIAAIVDFVGRCAKCGRTEDGVVMLYNCQGCHRSVCREHYLLDAPGRTSSSGQDGRFEAATGCAICAPEAFARYERFLASQRGIDWAALRPRLVALAVALACATGAHLVYQRGWPRWAYVLLGLVGIGALLKTLPKAD